MRQEPRSKSKLDNLEDTATGVTRRSATKYESSSPAIVTLNARNDAK